LQIEDRRKGGKKEFNMKDTKDAKGRTREEERIGDF
jgi:hypothetical protein